jgi:hypothetical protein
MVCAHNVLNFAVQVEFGALMSIKSRIDQLLDRQALVLLDH